MQPSKWLAAVAIAVTTISLSSPVTRAEDGARFGMGPTTFDSKVPASRSYFILDGQPGMTLQSEIRITNSGPNPGAVQIYAVDATTAQASDITYLAQEDPRQDVGAWTSIGITELRLGSGESQVIPFSVTVPDNARAGQHIGAIVTEDLARPTIDVGDEGIDAPAFHVNIRERTAVAVQVTIPGQVEERVEITGVTTGGEAGYQRMFLGLQNSGNMMVKPTGSLQVRDAQGQLVQDHQLALGILVPQTEIEYPVLVKDKALEAGSYQAAVVLKYGDGQEARTSSAFAVTQQQVDQVFTSALPLAPPAGVSVDAPAALGVTSPLMLVITAVGVTLGLVLLLAGGGFLLYARRRRSSLGETSGARTERPATR